MVRHKKQRRHSDDRKRPRRGSRPEPSSVLAVESVREHVREHHESRETPESEHGEESGGHTEMGALSEIAEEHHAIETGEHPPNENLEHTITEENEENTDAQMESPKEPGTEPTDGGDAGEVTEHEQGLEHKEDVEGHPELLKKGQKKARKQSIKEHSKTAEDKGQKKQRRKSLKEHSEDEEHDTGDLGKEHKKSRRRSSLPKDGLEGDIKKDKKSKSTEASAEGADAQKGRRGSKKYQQDSKEGGEKKKGIPGHVESEDSLASRYYYGQESFKDVMFMEFGDASLLRMHRSGSEEGFVPKAWRPYNWKGDDEDDEEENEVMSLARMSQLSAEDEELLALMHKRAKEHKKSDHMVSLAEGNEDEDEDANKTDGADQDPNKDKSSDANKNRRLRFRKYTDSGGFCKCDTESGVNWEEIELTGDERLDGLDEDASMYDADGRYRDSYPLVQDGAKRRSLSLYSRRGTVSQVDYVKHGPYSERTFERRPSLRSIAEWSIDGESLLTRVRQNYPEDIYLRNAMSANYVLPHGHYDGVERRRTVASALYVAGEGYARDENDMFSRQPSMGLRVAPTEEEEGLESFEANWENLVTQQISTCRAEQTSSGDEGMYILPGEASRPSFDRAKMQDSLIINRADSYISHPQMSTEIIDRFKINVRMPIDAPSPTPQPSPPAQRSLKWGKLRRRKPCKIPNNLPRKNGTIAAPESPFKAMSSARVQAKKVRDEARANYFFQVRQKEMREGREQLSPIKNSSMPTLPITYPKHIPATCPKLKKESPLDICMASMIPKTAEQEDEEYYQNLIGQPSYLVRARNQFVHLVLGESRNRGKKKNHLEDFCLYNAYGGPEDKFEINLPSPSWTKVRTKPQSRRQHNYFGYDDMHNDGKLHFVHKLPNSLPQVLLPRDGARWKGSNPDNRGSQGTFKFVKQRNGPKKVVIPVSAD